MRRLLIERRNCTAFCLRMTDTGPLRGSGSSRASFRGQ